MALTPNYSFIIPTGTDAVNLLTQCFPNFTSLDNILKPIQESGVTVATATKVGTVHQLVRTDSSCNMFRFIATANYASGDTFTVDGASVTATAMDGTALPAGAFVINQSVVAVVNGAVLTVMIAGKETSSIAASAVTYDNTLSGLTATNAQDAIDELHDSGNIAYDNTGSGLTATDVQSAIDEIVSGSGGADHGVVELWVNPDVSVDYASSSVPITTDLVIDTFLVEAGGESGNASVLGSSETGYSGELNRFSINNSGDIIWTWRTFTCTATATGYNVAITDCLKRTRPNSGSVTNTTDNSLMIPFRILGIIHNN